jgi:DNA-binding response OmpR family regulator
VLGALLQRRGVETVGAGHARLGLRLAQTVSPDLIILDEDVITREDQTDCVDFVATAERQQVPLLVLGGTLARRNSDSNVQVIAKPYHYSALIRKIEGHLGTSDAA